MADSGHLRRRGTVPVEGFNQPRGSRRALALVLVFLAGCGGGGGGSGGSPLGGGGGGPAGILFADDFTSGLGPAWSGGFLVGTFGLVAPGIGLPQVGTAQYVGPFFPTAQGLTISVDAQYDPMVRFLFQVFDEAQPGGRLLAFEARDGELRIERREGDQVLSSGVFPTAPNNYQFHNYKISFAPSGEASFYFDGALRTTVAFPHSNVWMSFTNHPFAAAPSESLAHVDNVRVTSP
jgi:hypothetical protein